MLRCKRNVEVELLLEVVRRHLHLSPSVGKLIRRDFLGPLQNAAPATKNPKRVASGRLTPCFSRIATVTPKR